MKTNWDLTVFYKDFDDPAFKADLGGLDASIAALTEAVAAPCGDEAAKRTALVGQVEALGMTFERLMLMVELTLSVDAQNKPANAAMAPLMRSAMLMEQANNALGRYLSKLENLSELVHSNETLSARAFALLEMAENAKHQLPEALEGPVMKMQLSGGQAFSQLRDKLDATLTVDYDGKAIPLSAARAMAYDADADVRRKAYDAELASYKKLEIPMSYCLNNIKAEGETMAKLRGYKGVLDMALAHFRMDEKTLDAMWTAIREALPELREYFKAKGRLQNLADRLKAEHPGLAGGCGIGHTRWATHGEPNDTNAHPQVSESGRFAVVHNGIIENYAELKKKLLEKGYTFRSETDTEVVAQLLDWYYRDSRDVFEAVTSMLSAVEGTYALGILCADTPDRLIAARKDAPLLLGYGEGENFIASDVTALLRHTRNVVYMDDGELAVVSAVGIRIYDERRRPQSGGAGSPAVRQVCGALHVLHRRQAPQRPAGKGPHRLHREEGHLAGRGAHHRHQGRLPQRRTVLPAEQPGRYRARLSGRLRHHRRLRAFQH